MSIKGSRAFYVVTNKGQVVEEVHSLWDGFVKRFNLAPAINLLLYLMDMLIEQIHNYPAFLAFKKLIDEIIESLNKFALRWGIYL